MKKNNMRYEVTIYTPETDVEPKSVTADELRNIDLKAYDHVMLMHQSRFMYRDHTGQWHEKPIDGSGLGPVCQDIMLTIQMNAGNMLGPLQISELTSNEDLCGNNALAVRISKLRVCHGESPSSPWFFVTRTKGGYGLMWPAERTWLRVDPLK